MKRTILTMCTAIVTFQLSMAAVFLVTNDNDAGTGSFRQAILDANNLAGKDTIRCNISGTVKLETAFATDITLLPSIDDTLCIFGNGIMLEAQIAGRILQINRPSVINDVIFKDGTAIASGGGVRTVQEAGYCVFDGCTFLSNSSSEWGGGLALDCSALLEDCFFEGNETLDGGGLALRFNIEVCLINCTFKDNIATGHGGAIWIASGSSGPGHLILKSGHFENTMGPFDQEIYVKEDLISGTGAVTLVPGFEVPVMSSLFIIYGP